jgi:hypothetical protein
MAARSLELSVVKSKAPKVQQHSLTLGKLTCGLVLDVWQEYTYGLNGQEPWREQERRGVKWRQDPIDPRTKRGYTFNIFWSTHLSIFCFIEMRIFVGDSEAVAVETCQEIVNKNLNRNGFPDWKVLSSLLRGVVRQEENDPTNTRAFITIASRETD